MLSKPWSPSPLGQCPYIAEPGAPSQDGHSGGHSPPPSTLLQLCLHVSSAACPGILVTSGWCHSECLCPWLALNTVSALSFSTHLTAPVPDDLYDEPEIHPKSWQRHQPEQRHSEPGGAFPPAQKGGWVASQATDSPSGPGATCPHCGERAPKISVLKKSSTAQAFFLWTRMLFPCKFRSPFSIPVEHWAELLCPRTAVHLSSLKSHLWTQFPQDGRFTSAYLRGFIHDFED